MMRIFRFIFIALCVVFVTSCARPLFNLQHFPAPKFTHDNTENTQDYPDSDALVLLKKRTVDIGIETRSSYHKVTKVFNNISNYAEIRFSISAQDIFESFSARTIKPDGTVINVTEKDIYMMQVQKNALNYRSGSKEIRFSFPALEKNAIIELKYTTVSRNPYIDVHWDVAEDIPVKKNTFIVKVPAFIIDESDTGLFWNYKLYNIDKNIQKSTSRIRSRNYYKYSWDINDIPAFKGESKMPHISQYQPYGHFNLSNWNTWNQLAKWYYNSMLKHALKETPKLIKLAKELTVDKKTEIEKIESIYEYVNKIRYSSSHEIFGHGIDPVAAHQVIDRNYGDCKDKSILMISLLKAAGITAYPVLVNTYKNIDEKMISFGSFDHMITQIELKNKTIWADPTFSFAPLGYVQPHSEGKQVLVIKTSEKEKSELVTIPASSFSDNYYAQNAAVKITSPAKAEISVTIAYKGNFAIWEKNYARQLSKQGRVHYCKNHLSNDFFNVDIKNIAFKHMDDFSKDFKISFTFTTDQFIHQIGSNQYTLNTTVFKTEDQEAYSYLRQSKRTYPLHWLYSYKQDTTIDIDYPATLFTITSLPSHKKLEHLDGALLYAHTAEQEENKISMKSSFIRKNRELPAEKYNELRTFFSNLKKSVKEKIIINGSKLTEIKKPGISIDS